MTLQFAIFDHIEGLPGTSMQQLLADRLELVKMADEAGFAAYHLAEHHGSDLCLAPSQEIFLAAAAQATNQIRLGPMVKILPLHHPLRVVEDVCLLDQLSGGRVEFGVGRGIAAIEHFWFGGNWSASHERFDEALALVLQGLRTGSISTESSTHYEFPPVDVTLTPLQRPNPPFWYPGNPETAGRYGMSLMWPGPVPEEAYQAYVDAWHEHADDPVRADVPGAEPRVGTALLFAVSHDEAEARDAAARAWKGLMRRILAVHDLDRLALSAEEAEAALNPLARAGQALLDPGGEAILDQLTAMSGTPDHVTGVLKEVLAQGRSDYLVLQVPTGDMTFEEARQTLRLFIDEVMPQLV